MSAILLPTTCVKGEWEETVFSDQIVLGPDPADTVYSSIYELNFTKASLGMALWVKYTPVGANTLTVGVLWSTRGGSEFFPALDGPSVILTKSSVIKVCCPGTPDFQFSLLSSGTGGDVVTAILCGKCGCCGGGGC